jgi:hypothetical protein
VHNWVHEVADADAAYTRAEHMKFLYPPPEPRTRSQQFAVYLRYASNDWPPSVAIPMWFGCVYSWLDHPGVGERDMFEDAIDELTRLRKERICPES